MITFLRLFAGCSVDLASFALLCSFPFTSYFRLPRKKTVVITLCLIFSLSMLYASFGTYFQSVLPYNNQLYLACNNVFLCCLFPCFFWYLYAVKAVWQKKAFIFLFTMTSALFISSVSNCILNVLPGEGSWLPDTPITILATLLANIIVVPLLCLFLNYFYLPVENGMTPKEIGFLSLPLLLLFTLFFVIFSYVDFIFLASNITVLLLYFGLLITVFILYAVIFKMYWLAHERYLANEKYARTQYQADIRSEQYRRISQNIENTRKMRHDLQHHMLTLQGYLETGQTEQAAEYLRLFSQSMQNHKIITFCSNPAVNMLVSHYYDIAHEQGITLSTHIDIPENLSVPDTDLSVLIGNLLENAVTAAMRAEQSERQIRLNMSCSGRMLGITVDNGFDGIVRQKDDRYLSTKSDNGGLGLKILADIAEKYDGGVSFSHKGTIFYSSVMLRLETQTGIKDPAEKERQPS